MTEKGNPRVAIIGTGGTIAYAARDPLDMYEYFDFGRILEVHELVEAISKLTGDIELVPVKYQEMSSDAIGPGHWLELTDLVHLIAEEQDPLDGIVITHGTSSMEETAYFLNLTSKVDLPIVLVGAQRPWGAIGSDGPLNLVNAVRVAAARDGQGLGVVAVHDNAVWAAREFAKISNSGLNPFETPDLGMLGYVDADARVVVYRTPTRRHAPDTVFDTRDRTTLPRVDIAYAYAGADGTAIEAFVAAGCQGLVIAGMPPGSGAALQEDAIDQARTRGVMVVLSTRAFSGRVMERTSLRERGIVAADNLTPQKARILTMLALTVTSDPHRLQEIFHEY